MHIDPSLKVAFLSPIFSSDSKNDRASPLTSIIFSLTLSLSLIFSRSLGFLPSNLAAASGYSTGETPSRSEVRPCPDACVDQTGEASNKGSDVDCSSNKERPCLSASPSTTFQPWRGAGEGLSGEVMIYTTSSTGLPGTHVCLRHPPPSLSLPLYVLTSSVSYNEVTSTWRA